MLASLRPHLAFKKPNLTVMCIQDFTVVVSLYTLATTISYQIFKEKEQLHKLQVK